MKPIWTALVAMVVGCGVPAADQPSGADACVRGDGGTAYTPGTVVCNGTACPADQCLACRDASGTLEISCGGQPGATCEVWAVCDGPEDCPQGERCYAFEGTTCAAEPYPPGSQLVCHTDLDCECDQSCVVGECQPK